MLEPDIEKIVNEFQDSKLTKVSLTTLQNSDNKKVYKTVFIAFLLVFGLFLLTGDDYSLKELIDIFISILN